MTRRGLAAGLAAAASLTMVACSSPPPEPDHPLSWSSLVAHGFGDGVLAIALRSQPDWEEHETHYLAIVGRDGVARIIKGGEESVGPIAAAGATLCVPSDDHFYRVTATSAERDVRPSRARFSGHWSGVASDGSCVFVSNDGGTEDGYFASIYTQSNGQWRRSPVPDVPDGVGVSDGAVWLSNTGTSSTTIEKRSTVYRADRASGTVTKAVSWPVFRGRVPGGPGGVDYEIAGGSELFPYKNKLYYVEELAAYDDEAGEHAEIAPGQSWHRRLVEMDPVRGTATSTFLNTFAGYWDSGNPDGFSSLEALTQRGFLHRGAIYTVNAEAELVALDLETKRSRTVARLSRTLRDDGAWDIVQNGDRLLFLTGTPAAMVLETYDLDTGKLIRTQPVTGLQSLLDAKVSIDYIADLTP